MPAEDLDGYMTNYTGFNDWLMRQRYALLGRHFRGATCLEMGSATGEGTGFLLDHFDAVTAVDGSESAVDALREKFAGRALTAECSYFEDFVTDQRFDTVVLAHILEHVDDPQGTLAVAKRLVADGGVIIIDVPNAYSVHRQMGVEMGMLAQVTDLNEADLSIGHRRVYTPDTLREEMASAGLRVATFGGIFLKPLSNAQCEETFSQQQLEALLTIGERYPDIAADIFVVAELMEDPR